jgi:hypothetical protein
LLRLTSSEDDGELSPATAALTLLLMPFSKVFDLKLPRLKEPSGDPRSRVASVDSLFGTIKAADRYVNDVKNQKRMVTVFERDCHFLMRCRYRSLAVRALK